MSSNNPPFFPQERSYTCSLAVLRMILATFGHQVTEDALLEKGRAIPGTKTRNFANTTIATVASDYLKGITLEVLTKKRLKEIIEAGGLIQLSIKKGSGYHSLLVYKIAGEVVYFHDPSHKENQMDIDKLLKLNKSTGKSILYTR